MKNFRNLLMVLFFCVMTQGIIYGQCSGNTTSLPTATLGQPYHACLSLPDPYHTCYLPNNVAVINLPAGLTYTSYVYNYPNPLTGSGIQYGDVCIEISGTPTATVPNNTITASFDAAAGSFSPSVQACVTGGGVNTVTQTVSFSVVSTNTNPLAGEIYISSPIKCHGLSNGALGATASGGTPPYTYLWNTGAVTQTISGLTGGTYLCQISDAMGSTVADTIVLTEPAALDFNVAVYPTNLGMGDANIEFTNISGGAGGFMYSYENMGDTFYTDMADINGNTVIGNQYIYTRLLDGNQCITAHYTYIPPSDIVSTIVDLNGNFPLTSDSFDVFIINFDTTGGGTLTLADSLVAYYGGSQYNGGHAADTHVNFTIDNYVKAALRPSSSNYASYLPTYYGTSLYWTGATPAPLLDITGGGGTYIPLIVGNNPGGPGFIGGLISLGANKTTTTTTTAASRVEVLLLDANQNPVAYTYTNANGEYSFSNIAYGNYLIHPEIFGKQTYPLAVSLSAANPSATNQDLLIQHDSIFSVVSIETPKMFSSFALYPNPTQNIVELKMQITKPTTVEIDLFDLAGKHLYSTQTRVETTKTYPLDLSTYAEGIYYLRVGTPAGGYRVEKVMKK